MAALATIWWFSLPQDLFETPYSTAMYDREGQLLNARVAADGQWRFPAIDKIPGNYRLALLHFEDRYYPYHPGVNPLSVFRAMITNLTGGKTTSGASTISMQVIRLSRQGKPRTLREKLLEAWLATRLELRYSKSEILAMYASHAPFGGNVVGISAASWRYFGHGPQDLSWAQAATLAVLPNSPSLIFPGRNQELLLKKRNRLLETLQQRGLIDTLELQLALAEPLPGRPYPLPRKAPHLFGRTAVDGLEGQLISTTIDAAMQENIKTILMRHQPALHANHIHNMAVLVANVNTGNVLAYWGNIPDDRQEVKAAMVDIIEARRSPGSLLKPFLYAGLLQEGLIMPRSLVPDIPTRFSGFNPQNFNRTYDGAVPADRALARSLNVPAVNMLMDYHPERFQTLVEQCGLKTFDQPASHYGLSMILGGGEVKMWEIAGAFASMARALNLYKADPYPQAEPRPFHPLTYRNDQSTTNAQCPSPFSPAVIWQTLEAMVEAARPDTEANWQRFSSSRRVAWKTGTSHGLRDAWAIGVDPEHVVAVWAGNATGEGRPGLTGIAVAAPVMFEVFGLLPAAGWFAKPFEDMKQVEVCRKSGFAASSNCIQTDTLWVPLRDYSTGPCPYHIRIHLDKKSGLRVNSSCASLAEMEPRSWFVLPPVQEYYFKSRNPFYRILPPFREGCSDQTRTSIPMQWIYPNRHTTIYIPYELDGSPGEAIFSIAHRHENATLHWHLNHEYLGQTKHFHDMALRPGEGEHLITVVDQNGHILEMTFEVITRHHTSRGQRRMR